MVRNTTIIFVGWNPTLRGMIAIFRHCIWFGAGYFPELARSWPASSVEGLVSFAPANYQWLRSTTDWFAWLRRSLPIFCCLLAFDTHLNLENCKTLSLNHWYQTWLLPSHFHSFYNYCPTRHGHRQLYHNRN